MQRAVTATCVLGAPPLDCNAAPTLVQIGATFTSLSVSGVPSTHQALARRDWSFEIAVSSRSELQLNPIRAVAR